MSAKLERGGSLRALRYLVKPFWKKPPPVPEAFVTHQGVRLWTVPQGAGQAVMLCNGGPGCPDYLGPVAGMVDNVAQVIRFEERGCGRSDAGPPYSIEASVEDLEAVRQHYNITRWVVGGHS